MRDTIYAIITASVAMLLTSGVVAFATAAPKAMAPDVVAEEFVGEMLATHYQEVVDRQAPVPYR